MAEILDLCEEKVEKNDSDAINKLNRYHEYVGRVKGISSQAYYDIQSLTPKQCALLAPLGDFVSEFLNMFHPI